MPTFHIDFEQDQKKIGQCVNDVLHVKNCRRATAYLSERKTVKATIQRRIKRGDKAATVLVTVGIPNFVERRFVRLCKKDGMVFPLNQIQHKFWPEEK